MELGILEGVKELMISEEGVFKYILIQVLMGDQIVGWLIRGNKKYNYHADNFDAFKEELKDLGFEKIEQSTGKKNKKGGKGKIGSDVWAARANKKVTFRCLGGGRI